MKSKKTNIVIVVLSVALIAAYSIGICLTYEIYEALAYLSELIAASIVGLPLLVSYCKTGKALRPIAIVVTILLFVALVGFDYWNWKSNFRYLLLALWPVICYGAISFVMTKIKSNRNIWIGMAVYNIAVVLVIYLANENMYKYFAADIIAEAYMYIIAQIALFFVIKKHGFRKNEITTYVICNIIFPLIWFLTQDRIEEIISLSHSFDSVDQESEFVNWIAQRGKRLRSGITGDYSNICKWYMPSLINKCQLFYFYAKGYGFLSAAIVLITLTLCGFLVKLAACNRNNNLLKIFIITFVFQNIIGLLANIFLFHTTDIGIMFMRNKFDIIPLMWIFLSRYTRWKNYGKRI